MFILNLYIPSKRDQMKFEVKSIPESIFKALLFIFMIYFPTVSAKEYSGVWATDCKSTNSKVTALRIIRASSDGMYQVVHPRIKMSKPTSVIGDNDFVIISGETLIYKNIRYHRCSKSDTPKYTPILESQIKKYLQGEWKVKYQQRAGITNNISNGKSGLPDLTFINEDHAKISLKKQVRPIFYEVENDNILLKTAQVNPLKVHLIDEKELHLSFEVKPESGVFIYYKYGDAKIRH